MNEVIELPQELTVDVGQSDIAEGCRSRILGDKISHCCPVANAVNRLLPAGHYSSVLPGDIKIFRHRDGSFSGQYVCVYDTPSEAAEWINKYDRTADEDPDKEKERIEDVKPISFIIRRR